MTATADTPAQLRRIADPITRVRAARQAKEALAGEYDSVIAGGVRDALAAGYTLASIGEALGLTRQRVHQLSRLGNEG